jgi:hypothetical protein
MEMRLSLFHSLLHVRDLLGAPEAHWSYGHSHLYMSNVSTFGREVAPLDVNPKHLK